MTDVQIVILILLGIFLLFIVGMNFSSMHVYKIYKKKYNEFKRGVYKFEPNLGHQCYFYLYDYDINTHTRSRTNINMIFFPDGDIKLDENVYIHKWQIWTSFVKWYYYRKFHRLKDDAIREYNIREAFRTAGQNRESILYERYMKQQKLDFKFFRG